MSTILAPSSSTNNPIGGTLADPSRPRSSLLFYFGLVLIFVRFSMIHQIMASLIGTNFYIMYWVGIPTIMGLLLSGGFRRTLSLRPAQYWFLFGLWGLVAVPFSFWPSNSLLTMLIYWRIELLMLFVIAGIVTNWRECRLVFVAIVMATFLNLLSSRLFGQSDPNQRLSLVLPTSAVANANDFAAHLVFVLPFVLWLAMSSRSLLVRALSFLAVAYGMHVVLASGSRGVSVALAAQILFLLFFSPSRRRVLIWVFAAVFLAFAIAFVPAQTWDRIASIYRSNGVPREALESMESREYLLKKSIEYTFEHPLLGIGPGQFANYEGAESKSVGLRGSWHDAHNSYTQASSETGIPGGVFFFMGTLSTLLLLNRTSKRAQLDRKPREILNAIFCLRLAFVGIATAVLFVNFAYYFYLPAITGLALAISGALGTLPEKKRSLDVFDYSAKDTRLSGPLVRA
jgi:O-antigen ligase